MDLHFRARLCALACSALVIVSSGVVPQRPAIALAAEAPFVDVVAAPEPAPFTLYIQPSAPPAPTATADPASPPTPVAPPPPPPPSPSPSPTLVAPSSSAPAGFSSGNRRDNVVIAPMHQPRAAHAAAPAGRAARAASAPAVMVSAQAQPQLTYSGGPVERASSINYSIFWKPAGTSMSANYQTLINRYFQDIGGSQFYGVMTQYTDTGGSIVNSASLGGTWTDTTPYPSNTPTYPANTLTDHDIQQSVIRAMNTNNWWPASHANNANFFVYTAAGEESCVSTGMCSTTVFCAYHSNFTPSGTSYDIKYANHPYDGSHLNGCGVPTSPNNDMAADSEINSTSHEHFEMVTDPDPFTNTAWLDANGDENGDKCLGVFYGTNGQPTAVSLHNHPYLVQQEWSNIEAGCAWSLPQQSFILTAGPLGAGNGVGSVTLAPLGITCATTCSASFPAGALVTLTATPASGSTFVGWGGACSGTGACTATLNAEQSVTAAFNLTPCSPRPQVTVSVTPSGAGRFQATVTSTGTGNTLQSIQFGSATNALIDIGSQTGRSGNFTVASAAGTSQVTFFVRRGTPGVATTVPLVVTDSCGAWSTFVGVGSSVP